MKKIIVGAFLCLAINNSYGQSEQILGIGDTLPQINVQVLMNDEVVVRPLSSFYKNSFVILDFWATWCAPCVSAIADADSVIKKVNKNVQVLPVTYQSTEEIRNFIKNNPVLNKLNLNFVTDDTILMGKQIQFKQIPHEVWVDQSGVIKAITYPDEITVENVEKFVRNESLDLPQKVDIMDFDFDRPQSFDTFYYRSIFGPYKQGSGSITGVDGLYLKNDYVKKFLALNVPIMRLFYAAYSSNEPHYYKDRIELHVRDSVSLNPNFAKRRPPRKILKEGLYCYELILPEKIPSNLFFSYLLQEINRLSKYKGAIEKREKDCWIIYNAIEAKNPAKSVVANKLQWERGILKGIHHESLDLLTRYLNWNMSLPVVNETNFDIPVDMSFDFDAVNIQDEISFTAESVRGSLKKYGFDIKKGKRFVDVLVIYEE